MLLAFGEKRENERTKGYSKKGGAGSLRLVAIEWRRRGLQGPWLDRAFRKPAAKLHRNRNSIDLKNRIRPLSVASLGQRIFINYTAFPYPASGNVKVPLRLLLYIFLANMSGGRTILLLRTNHSDSDQLHRSKGKEETRWCYKFVEYLRWNLGWFIRRLRQVKLRTWVAYGKVRH